MIVVLLGPPGAGKGTQCKRIIDKLGLTHLSSGDIFRSEISSGSDLGNKAKQYIDNGDLVPDNIVVGMMISAIDEVNGDCVLDGFPRTVVQAQELDTALGNDGMKVDAVVNLLVDDEVVVDRLSKRRVCSKCGAVYHLEYNQPNVENKCDFDNADLYQRDDDTKIVIQNRLKTYHELTEPLVKYYGESNSEVLNIVANKPVEVVTDDILEKLDIVMNGN